MSVKRVFAIIGIVIGCVTAFVGGVLGVMALMGKFKTPVVKPEKLYFENPEQVVVAQYKDDDGKDVIYSFNLKAENNSIDHEVNVKDCFIWFEKGVGEDLIQLCDKDGNLLTADSKKRYAVNCNETLYFKIKVFYDKYDYNSSTWESDCKKLFIIQDGKYALNESEEYDSSLIYYTMQTYEEKYSSLDLESLINGKVVLRARTADDTVQTSQDLVIWVDRNVSSIFLDYGDIPTDTSNPIKEQRINIGVDKEIEFNYVVNPEISLQPMSKESKKIVELYYDDPKSTDEDFVLVNLENIKNRTRYSLYEIFDEDKCYIDDFTGETRLVFRSSKATNGIAHYFKLAIFPSYNAREEFLAQENAEGFKKHVRLQHMVTTDLYIQVVNINIDKVTLSDGELNLNLFTDDNVVYLRNEEAESLNLNVEMFAGVDKIDVRFDELDFKTISENMLSSNPKFVLETLQEVDVKEINFADINEIIFNKETKQLKLKNAENELICLVDTVISIGDYAIINKLTYDGRDYLCNNGVALVYIGEDDMAKPIKMLEVDSYLDFYIKEYDEEKQEYFYTLATDEDVEYSVEIDGLYSNKKWNIVVKNVSNDITNGDKTLVLGLLIVNNEGKFNMGNLFATKPVTINVQDIHYSVTNSTANLNLLAKNAGFVPEDSGKDFDFFINIDEGTYNACVFVISAKNIDKAIVEYVENLYYKDTKGTLETTDDEVYYVVGYFEGGNFVNKVRTKDNSNVTKETEENKLQMLQLKNIWGDKTQESASETIKRLIGENNIATTEVDISANVQELFKTNISVKQNLVIDDEVEFDVVAVDAVTGAVNPASFYSKTEDHTITIKTSNAEIITKICDFYGIVKGDGELDTTYILNNYPQNANITGELKNTDDEKSLILTLNVGEILSSDVKVEIKMVNVFKTKTEQELFSFNIVNSAPEKIAYNYDGGSIELAENQDNAPVVTAEITWGNNDYSYNWYYGYIDKDSKGQSIAIKLNPEISGSTELGFQDQTFKVTQKITYSLSNNAISIGGTDLVINNVTDNTYLSVTIAGVTRYLKLNVVQVGFELIQGDTRAIPGNEGSLSEKDIVRYKYNGINIYKDAFTNIDLSNISVLYANSNVGTLTVLEEIDEVSKKVTKYTYIYDVVDTVDDLIILTIENTGSDWKFTRVSDVYAALSVEFKIVTKTNALNCSIKFTSGIEYEYNASAWGVTPKLYQDTTILLYEEAENDKPFNYQPLIKIRDTAGKTITVVNDVGIKYENVLTLSLGEHKFNIKADEDLIGSLSFTVVPNVVIKQTGDLTLDSGSNNVSTAISEKVKLYEYVDKLTGFNSGDSIIYGQTKDDLDKIILYSVDDIVLNKNTPNVKTSILCVSSTLVTMQSKEKTDDNELYVESYVENIDGTDITKIKTAWIDLIGEMQEVNVVVTSSGYEVGGFKAIVKNNNKVLTDGLTITSDNVLNLKAMLDYVGQFSVEGKTFNLSKIEWIYSDADNNLTFENPDIKIPTLNKRFENVTLKLTFTGTGDFEGKTLVFNGKTINGVDLTINVVPFELDNSDNINKAYSQKQFNLLKDVIIDGETIYGVYNASDLSKFNYIKVLSVKDENGNSLIPDNLNLGFAYNYANPSNGLTITFDKLYADSVKALIEYEVQYAGSTETYTYKKAISLQNWQDLQVQYPENEAATDADKYLTIDEVTLSNGVKYENVQYESVVIDNLDSYTIDLKDIKNKNINRITAKDRTKETAEFTTDYVIESLEILAYENTINFPNFVNTYGNIVLDKDNATVTFNHYTQPFYGIIVFRLTSTSGNYVDYFVRVTCLGGKTEVSGNAEGFIEGEYAGNTITNIVSTYSGFKNKFGVDYDATKVKMFLLNATVLASDNKIYVGDSIVGADTQYTCVNDKTLTISDYTTITLSLIYSDSENGYVYPIGILTLYLRPTLTPNPVVTSSTIGAGYSLANDKRIENGEFKYTIPANSNPIPFPTDFDVAKTEKETNVFVDYILNSNGELVAGIDGIDISSSNITIVNQVTSAKVFTVFYTKDGYTIKVIYIIEPVEIKAGSTHTIGELNEEKTQFVDTFVIDAANYEKYFGTYQGKITIGNEKFKVGAGYTFSVVDDEGNAISKNSGNITNGVEYKINSGVLTLIFTQGLYDVDRPINVYYTNLSVTEAEKTISYTFNVKRGLYIETAEGDNQGINSSQRKTTETATIIDYTDDAGSMINIKKSDITDGVKYEFAGYKIYIKDSNGLMEFKFNEADSPFVLSDNYLFTLNTNTLTFAPVVGEDYSTSQIEFVHMPKTKNVNVTFTISNGTEEFKTDASTIDVRNLYLTLAKTYQQVEAIYVTQPGEVDTEKYYPEAENVIKGTTINLHNHLFGKINVIPSDIANKFRLKLKKLDETYVDSDINFAGIGFADSTNPNFINFTLGANSKATLTLNADNTQNIIFDNNVSSNEKCIVYLDNIAGIPTAEYIFQIMADDKVDGFTFSNEGYPDEDNNYMSFVIRKDEVADAEYSTGKLKIGTINDGLSKGVHVLKGTNWVFLPKAGTDNERKLPFTNVAVEIPANSQGTHQEATIKCSYDVILEMDPYNNANWDIYINFHRPEGDYHLPDMVTIDLSIYGTSGYILNNLEIVLFNTEIGPKYAEGTQSIYGGESFNILNHSEYGLKVPTGVDLDDVTFELAYDLSMVGESGYAINTPLSSYKYDTNKNSLVEFVPDTNILTTKTVGKNVNINLVFEVKIGDYYLNNVTYQIQLLRSLQFFFNGEEPVITDGEWKPNSVTSYTTNFVLTNVDGSDVITFANSDMKFSFNGDGDNKTIGKDTYFTNLLFELEDCVGGQAAGISIIKDPSKTNPDDSILKVDNTAITFFKDYSGTLYLTLTAGLRNGFNYTVSWTIEVYGILDIQPQNKTDNEGLTSSSMPYSSGQNVDLLGKTEGGSTGLYLKDMKGIGSTALFDNYISYDETSLSDNNKLKATYQYAIIKYNPYDGYNNQQRFEKFVQNGGTLLGERDLKVSERTINIPLPIVPTTGTEESYLVIYEVEISYLGYGPLTYYVAYRVVYNLSIGVTALEHGNGTAFDVDNINVNTRLTTEESVTTYLDLFKYSETYTHTTAGSNPVTTNYIIRLGFNEVTDKAVYQAKIDGGTFEEVQIKPTSNANMLEISVDGGTNWITITKSTDTTLTERYWKTTGTINNVETVKQASLFTLNFNNITEFAKFIDDIDGIVIKQPTVEYKYNVVHIVNGRWGIDLSNWNGKVNPGDVLFKNKLEDAEFIIKAKGSGQTIYSIPKYDAQQKTGFRMHTSKELIAAGSQKFNDLFVSETVTEGWLTYQYYDIIGVYGNTISSPEGNWVYITGDDSNPTVGAPIKVDSTLDGEEDVEIKVPTGESGSFIKYELYKVKYSVDSGGIYGICSLEQDFYVVYCEDYDAVYKMNLNPGSVELYKQGEDTIVNLRNYFVKYKNINGKLVVDENAKVTDMNRISGADIVGEQNGNTYVIKEENLIAYRNANLTVGNDVTITYSVKFGGVDMKISVNYQLPSLSTVVAYQNSLASEVDITSIYVPVYDEDGDMTYGTLTSYLSNVTSIVENGSNYTAENGFIKDLTTEDYTGYIKLDKTAVDNYFDSHTTAKFLEIKYTITTKTENKSESIDFVIVVRRGSST